MSILALRTLDNTSILELNHDPKVTATVAPISSLAVNILTSKWYIKTGSGDNDWSLLASNLENVDNTSDLNKPVSTAVQSALDLKYNASNPNGYETPSQLNTRDTNNRARANHTGTQLASTISDFASSVRATVLTGLSLAVDTAVQATDTILQAIGKLQQQLNSKVFGNGFEEFIDNTPFSTTTNYGSPAVAGSFTTAVKEIGKYRIGVTWNFSNNSTGSSVRFWVYVDGVQLDNFVELEAKDITDDVLFSQWGYVTFASATTHTIELRCASEASNQVTVNLIRAEIWRVS